MSNSTSAGAMSVGKFEIKGRVDEDGHLTLWVIHKDGSKVIDFGEDVEESEKEFAVRLTSESIEKAYSLSSTN